ncbi:MAG: hypothetical protein DMG04_16005 [Acidobacteria bacterium]|nr:MAG: hypothetical protein DMG04_16005 [Acidobacteriota bacterium]
MAIGRRSDVVDSDAPRRHFSWKADRGGVAMKETVSAALVLLLSAASASAAISTAETRTKEGSTTWSAPLFMQLAKGTWGLQIGAAEIDLVMLVMNQRGAEKLLNNKVSLGADATIAAGPVGRAGSASTDAQFSAEILSYSRSRGVFAGIDLSGGVLRPDDDPNSDVYGPNKSARDVVMGTGVPVPTAAQDFVRSLSQEARATTGKK